MAARVLSIWIRPPILDIDQYRSKSEGISWDLCQYFGIFGQNNPQVVGTNLSEPEPYIFSNVNDSGTFQSLNANPKSMVVLP